MNTDLFKGTITDSEAAAQQVVGSVDEDAAQLLQQVGQELTAAVQPLVEESAKWRTEAAAWRAEIAAWRELLGSGLMLHSGAK